jgi:hypothetical protein
MISIKINDLISIMETRLSTVLFDSFLDILHPDNGEKQYKKFESILRNALIQHTLHFPNDMLSPISLSNGTFIFTSNFDAYLQGPDNIGEDNIILVPDYIININYSQLNMRMPIGKKYYDYKKPKLISNIRSDVWVNYGTYYPLIIEYAPDGKFTDDSTLYYIDSQSQQFLTRLEFELLMYMKNVQDQIKIPDIGISILGNLDNQLERVEEDLNTWIKTSSSTISFWGS